MYSIAFSNSFKKDFKLCEKRNYDISAFESVIKHLSESGILPTKYKAHKLSSNYNGHWECHIKSDWLLIWTQDDINKEINLVRMGTHSDLF